MPRIHNIRDYIRLHIRPSFRATHDLRRLIHPTPLLTALGLLTPIIPIKGLQLLSLPPHPFLLPQLLLHPPLPFPTLPLLLLPYLCPQLLLVFVSVQSYGERVVLVEVPFLGVDVATSVVAGARVEATAGDVECAHVWGRGVCYVLKVSTGKDLGALGVGTGGLWIS